MIHYSINETFTKISKKEEEEREERRYNAMIKAYPDYYALSFRERIKIRQEFQIIK